MTGRLVFLLEERSMKVFLEGLLPRLFPQLPFLCVAHEGKSDLEKSIPRKLKGWREPEVRFLVLRDNDGADCRALKNRLTALCQEAGKDTALVRLACQELEAWYFGTPNALSTAYGKPDLESLDTRSRYRDPDAISRPSDELAKILPEFQKVSCARKMGSILDRDNRSRSFQVLLQAVERHLKS